jgi:hypothetical protein
MRDPHPHAFDPSGIPLSGDPNHFAGDVPDGPVMPAGYHGEYDGAEYDEQDVGPGPNSNVDLT